MSSLTAFAKKSVSIDNFLNGWRSAIALSAQGLHTPIEDMPLNYREAAKDHRNVFERQPQLSILSSTLYLGIDALREKTEGIFKLHNPNALAALVAKDAQTMIPTSWRKNEAELSWEGKRARLNETIISPDFSPRRDRVEEDRALVHGFYESAGLALTAERANQAVMYFALQVSKGGGQPYRELHDARMLELGTALNATEARISELLKQRGKDDFLDATLSEPVRGASALVGGVNDRVTQTVAVGSGRGVSG